MFEFDLMAQSVEQFYGDETLNGDQSNETIKNPIKSATNDLSNFLLIRLK